MPALLRTEHLQQQSAHTTGTKMVHLMSRKADVCTSVWNGPDVPLCWQPDTGLQGNFATCRLCLDSVQSKMSPFNWEERSHCVWYSFSDLKPLLKELALDMWMFCKLAVPLLNLSWDFFLKVTKKSCCSLTCRSGIDQVWGGWGCLVD